MKLENPYWSTFVCVGCLCTTVGATLHSILLEVAAVVLCSIGLRIAILNKRITK